MTSDGSLSKILTRVGSRQFFDARVGSATTESGKFPAKILNFHLVSVQKIPRSSAYRPLIYWGSKVCLGQDPSLL